MKFFLPTFAAILMLLAPVSHADAQNTPTPTASGPGEPGSAATLPAASFDAMRYQVLWTKSPFAVATSDTVGEESPDYYLVGIANLDGVSYASVIERQNQEHFLISTDKATRGLTLKSINHNHDGTETYAVVDKGGQSLTLKLEQPPAGAAGVPGAPQVNTTTPGNFAPQIPMPGGTPSFPGSPSVRPPFARFHRPPIHLPNPPQQAAPAPPQPTAPTPAPQ